MRFGKLILTFLGRRAVYRMGRALYQDARGDITNEMISNGEMLMQECVINAYHSSGLRESRLVVFDVGANIGDWSAAFLRRLAASSLSESVDLYAFEPVPSTAEIFKRNLGDQNPCLHFEQVALSSENGEANIHVGQGSGINSLHSNPLRGEEELVAICRVTGTDFCKDHKIKKVQLLKCDTEGHDMEVIRGALPMLVDGCISVLQFEYNHHWIFSRNFLRDAFIAIEKLPYKLVKLQSDFLLIFNEWHPELERFFEGNYALIHVDALGWFPTKIATWDHHNTMYVEGQ